MELHVVARLYGGENLKGRPHFYSKRTSLGSLLQAVQRADAQFTLLADGPISDGCRLMAAQNGDVIDLAKGPVGMRRSFIAAIDFAIRTPWPDDDLVYFCEDDYLHTPEAILHLRRAAEIISDASLFALYASTPGNPAIPGSAEHVSPHGWKAAPPAMVGGLRWINVPSTTSTFAARLGVLRQNRGIIRQSLVPYRRRYLDHELFMVMQGKFPYTLTELFMGPSATSFRSGIERVAANLFLSPFRIAYQVRALTRRRRPHFLYAADPNLASHMESDALAPGTDWARVAQGAEGWIEQRFGVLG